MGTVNRRITWLLLLVLFAVCILLLLAVCSRQSTESQPEENISATYSASSPAPTAISTPIVESFLQTFDLETWNYYKEIALYSEYGNSNPNGLIKKWQDDIRIYVNEFATEDDWSVLQGHVDAMNQISGIPHISFVQDAVLANMSISFITQSEMNKITEALKEISFGYTKIWWNQETCITRAQIYIVCDKQTTLERQHTILEELTQAMGLMNDSGRYSDSIFYVHYSASILSLSEMDWDLLRIHYADAIKAGMNSSTVTNLYPNGKR